MKNFKYSVLFLLSCLFLLNSCLHAQDSLIKVACVGNSITAGYGLENPSLQSYPAQLQTLFDSKKWLIKNFGVSSRTMLKTSDFPYWNEPQYKEALTLEPDVVIIKLGTNDAKRWIWNVHGKEYKNDYKEMIESFRSLSSKPEIFVCLAITGENKGWDIYKSYIKDSLNPKIREIALEEGVNLIDLYSLFLGKEKEWLMGDSVHPTTAGSAAIAARVKESLIHNKTRITVSNGILMAPQAEAYQWYFNRKAITAKNNGTSQMFKPLKAGFYMVSICPSKKNESRFISQEFLYDDDTKK
jgi:lysophospholipase L1-like esterase